MTQTWPRSARCRPGSDLVSPQVRVSTSAGKRSESFPLFSSGHVSAQRVALQVQRSGKKSGVAVSSFLEELVVRRELTDNFCFYNKKYDSVEGQCGSRPSTGGSLKLTSSFGALVVPRCVRVGPEDPERSRQGRKAVRLHTQAAGGGTDARQTLERCSGTALLNQGGSLRNALKLPAQILQQTYFSCPH